MPVHDAFYERRRRNGQRRLFTKTPLRRGFCFVQPADECLSTTLFMKEGGVTVSFGVLLKTPPRWGFCFVQPADECLSTTLFMKEGGVTVSFGFLLKTPLRRGFCFVT